MERDSQIGVASFRKLKQKNSGYVLLFLMLIIGSLSLYLSYQLSLKKINTQAWQVTKTATEFSYWFDIEKNYETDFSVATPTALNIITMNTLISTQRYLPYGLARAPGIPSSGTPAVTAVSEFQCSSLPGITKADELSDSGVSGSTDYTCPANASSTTNCKLGQPAYYSCAPSATAPSNSSAPTTAQYYINANHIALGATSNNAPIGLGLIVRTSGPASANISLTGGGTRGSLPNGSFAQSLVSSLPSASYNVYSTINSNVQGIGIGSYLITSTSTTLPNNRYSKIIDMGLVQSVDLTTASTLQPCFGWDSGGNKIGTDGSYTGGGTVPTGGVAGTFPPTCIRIDKNKYGPGGSENCSRLDLFFQVYRQYLQKDDQTSNGFDATSSRFFSSTDAMVTASTAGDKYLDVYLAQSIQGISSATLSSYTYSTSGPVPGNTTTPEEYNWLIYFLRCTRANT